MTTYFIRRILLMFPTFLGSTILVFIILQMAPGGPLEQAIQRIQMGAAAEGEAGGSASADISSGGGAVLPASALKELKRYYGFDKPIWARYLIWLGLYPRETRYREIKFKPDQFEISKRVGKRDGKTWKVLIRRDEQDDLIVFEDDDSPSSIWSAIIEETDEAGQLTGIVYQKKFSGIFTGNLGESYTYQMPVTEVMKPRFKISLFFGLTGMFLSYIVCIPLGIRKALAHGSPFDFASSVIIFVAYSIPGWALGGVFLVLFGGGSFWDVFPLGGFRSPMAVWETLSLWGKIVDQLHHAILPIFAWSIGSFAGMTVLMKNGLLENMSQDYIRTAFAKGLSEKRVVWLHAIRNSIIPIASGIGGSIGVIIAGSYFIEKVFNIDGFGRLGYQAILDRDYPITLAFLVIVVLIRLVGNIISDITLATVDPRIRFK
ncbi:MAG: ABC transporter permease subunit [Candidatus Marinimicrobia bacterium]|jgi:microcin C transport system permease protein|nr:ABC transporter permease subunit [Candidatus Neomarinimicrobiota bacterium]MBT3633737.1 ABC transporter permease subunit [Candidatus Neomarinimicrobiota bacterium]MBT3682529.1 ABC transporter permease subunit [Candidatus Neomarinimicrobiota bacterium]MBT3759293.1 ABC transporter permease subunit [Candidatus Neomarinimicrobiota bacterium]MBT3894699.1 ABC transporter permease subunit [Candidatus Neomarinimicrobiota bacterium]